MSANEEDDSDTEATNQWKQRRYSLQLNSSKGYNRTRAKLSIQPQLDSEEETDEPHQQQPIEMLSRQNTL